MKAYFCVKCMRHSDSFTNFDLYFLKNKPRLANHTGLDEFLWSRN